MKIQTTILTSASLSSLFNGSNVVLVPSSSTGTNINIDKVVWKVQYGSLAYDIPSDSYFNFSLLNYSLSSSFLYYPGFQLNYSSNYITSIPINIELLPSSSLLLEYSGSLPTTGNSTLQIDVYYDTINVTDTAPGFTFDNKTSFNAPVSIGNNVEARSTGSLAIGLGSITNNNYSHAEGSGSLTSGLYSHAEGVGTHAKKSGSHAEGQNTIADANYSHTEGSNTTTTGIASHAEGRSTQAVGNYSHAEGDTTIAFGEYSHASGQGTIASGSAQTVAGLYNRRNNTTDLFVIGNGVSDGNRSDIFNVSSTSVRITGSLNVSGSITGSLSGSITGSLFGTSSWATNASTASYVLNAVSSSLATSASNALTASSTPNALITASVSSNTLTFTKGNGTTFNLTVDTGSGGGGGTPGGTDQNIQINSGSSFAGYGTFIYDYLNNRVNYNNSINPYSTPLTNNNNNSVEFFNSVNNIQVDLTNYQFTTAQFPYCKYVTAQATDKIISLDTNAGTGLGPGLKMHSFKCDYTLSSLNVLDVLVATSKVGTLYCTWDEDSGTYNPVITDTATTSPGGLAVKLDDAAFTVAWNGANVELTLDLTLVTAVNVIFNGIFTIFSMK